MIARVTASDAAASHRQVPDVGSIGEAVSDGINGLLVRPAAPSQLTQALTALVTDEALRARLGAAARNRATDFGLQHWYQWLSRLWIDLSLPVT